MSILEKVKDRIKPRRKGVHGAAVALTLALALMLFLAPLALAAPKGVFARFVQCPTREAGVTMCLYLEVTGGVIAVGKASVPIERPLILQGGAVPTGGPDPNEYFVAVRLTAPNAYSNELVVPGGLQALLGCPREGCRGPSGGIEPNTVTASIEPAESPSNRSIFDLAAAYLEKGPAATLPMRVQLHNPLLGGACYLGSEAQPIEFRLTTGTTSPPLPNRPIAGSLGRLFGEVEDGWEATSGAPFVLVDNAFSVPSANGCGGPLAPLVDLEIDRALGLTSPAGRNTVILKGSLHMAEVEAVLASEAFPSK